MAGTHGDPPAVARQRVRRALRKAREEKAARPSQGDVAESLGWSLSKMQRIESGEVAVSPTDLKALLDIYEVSDQDLIDRLLRDARTARRERYVVAAEHRVHLTPAQIELMQFERDAVAIRTYQPVIYPGLVQTADVAEAVIRRWVADEVAQRVRFEARMARRSQVLDRADGPDYFLILDESVIRRRFGGVKATADQLEEFAVLALRPKVHVRVVPLTKGAEALLLVPFQIVTLGEGNSIVYTESFNGDSVLHEPSAVEPYREAFEQCWDLALSEGASQRAIVAEAARLRTLLDQGVS